MSEKGTSEDGEISLAGVALVGLHGNGAHFQSGDVLPQVVPFPQLGGG